MAELKDFLVSKPVDMPEQAWEAFLDIQQAMLVYDKKEVKPGKSKPAKELKEVKAEKPLLVEKQANLTDIKNRLKELGFKDDFIAVWITSPRPSFDGQLPTDLIKQGRGNEVLAAINKAFAT